VRCILDDKNEKQIARPIHLQTLCKWRETQLIKVVTGVRRCGKSTLLSSYIDYLKGCGVRDEQIIAINLEDPAYTMDGYRALYDYVKERLYKNGYTYVFLDEVQQCAEFERAVDGLFIIPDTDIYITGSNAFLLSGELATLLSGRYVTIDLLPFSFAEYTDFLGADADGLKSAFNDYLTTGSFPYAAALRTNSGMVNDYIEGVYNTILVKDVAKRAGITDLSLLENIVKFLCSAIGSPVSAKKISDTLCSSGRKTSVHTVETYLRALCDSYIFYRADRYDIRGKQYLKTLGKYYIVDTGIRNLLLTSTSRDLGHLVENIVFFELLRRKYRVSVGKLDETEVDFVAFNSDGTLYVQVALSVLDEAVLERELLPLQKINDNHQKILLTLDEIMPNANYDGIRQIQLIEWLMEEFTL
jgi:predicted AAA+ superfamily ATPase